MKTTLLTAAVTAALVAGVLYAGNEVLKMPDVHFSYSTGECVEVVNYTDTNYACDNYPNKYHHVWVK
jgi:hypothetical protein